MHTYLHYWDIIRWLFTCLKLNSLKSSTIKNAGPISHCWTFKIKFLQNVYESLQRMKPCDEVACTHTKSGVQKVVTMLKGGGGTKSVEVVLTRELELSTEGGGGAKSVHPLKGGGGKTFYPVFKGGGGEVSDLQFSHFVAPHPLPISNDRSLTSSISFIP